MKNYGFKLAFAVTSLILLLAFLPAYSGDKVSFELEEGWHQGPLPAATFQWGAVVPKGNSPESGFYFADFAGDHVRILRDSKWERLEPSEVAYWNNSLRIPIIKRTQAK